MIPGGALYLLRSLRMSFRCSALGCGRVGVESGTNASDMTVKSTAKFEEDALEFGLIFLSDRLLAEVTNPVFHSAMHGAAVFSDARCSLIKR